MICIRHKKVWKDGRYCCDKCGKGFGISKKEFDKRRKQPHSKAK